jgi:hypothetical protein
VNRVNPSLRTAWSDALYLHFWSVKQLTRESQWVRCTFIPQFLRNKKINAGPNRCAGATEHKQSWWPLISVVLPAELYLAWPRFALLDDKHLSDFRHASWEIRADSRHQDALTFHETRIETANFWGGRAILATYCSWAVLGLFKIM